MPGVVRLPYIRCAHMGSSRGGAWGGAFVVLGEPSVFVAYWLVSLVYAFVLLAEPYWD